MSLRLQRWNSLYSPSSGASSLWTTPGAQAQVLYGSVVGLITDRGTAIARAHVTLTNSQTNLSVNWIPTTQDGTPFRTCRKALTI